METRTILPSASPAEKPSTEGCANCGAPRTGPYCQACGQRHEAHLAPLIQLLKELPSALFNLDNRLFSTLRWLFLKPGHLTNTYLDGQRVRYVSPVRLYLLFSVLYFFIAAMVETSTFLFMDFQGDVESAEIARVLPKMMFVVVPVFAWFLHMLFRQPKRLYVAHLIFALHIQTVWYVCFVVNVVLEPSANAALEADAFPWLLLPVVVLNEASKAAVMVFLFLSLRRVYEKSRLETLVKMLVILFGYLVLLGLVTMVYVGVKTGKVPLL